MDDVVEYTEAGRTYRIMGLDAKAASIGGAVFEMDGLIGDLIDAATDALAEWRGPHAVTFAEDVNDVLIKMTSLYVGLWEAKSVVTNFPELGTSGGSLESIALRSARVDVPDEQGTVAAEPPKLKAYAMVAEAIRGAFPGLADVVDLDGVWAEVSWERALTEVERQNQIDLGVDPTMVDQQAVSETEPVGDVATLVPLVSPSPDVPALQAACQETGELAHGVAIAFENADQGLLDLLADYPDLAGFVVEGLGDGRISGESSLAILLAYFSDFDTAAHGGDGDGRITENDLRAIADDTDMPDYVREAAQYLVNNPVLFGLVESVNDSSSVLGEHGDGRLSQDDVETFLEFNDNLQVVAEHFDAFDVAAHGGEGDGRVSTNDLQAIAAGTGAMAQAAQWLLDHDDQRGRLDRYEDAKRAGTDLGLPGPDGTFSRESLVGLSVDQQVFADDPEAAHEFVSGLPIPERGDSGLPIWLCSDEGTKALANAALVDTAADLTYTQDVIAHLPETNGGVRNQLITAFYSDLAERADALFAGDLAGRPYIAGHPGANWLQYAPWASDGVRGLITADVSVFGVDPLPGQRQAAADGNQLLFDDIGSRYAAFVEMYEANPHPSDAQLEVFFANEFEDGDAQIRNGFAAYVGVMEETDPVRRQELMFQGNTLVAMHEQAKVDPYLHKITQAGPVDLSDEVLVRYTDLQVGTADPINLDSDLPATRLPNNHIDNATLLELDPDGHGPASYSANVPGATQVSVGTNDSTPGVVNVAPLDGIRSWDGDFPTSTETWWQEGAGSGSPDSMQGSGAGSWPDNNERMWTILKLFEQNHTNPELYKTGEVELELGNVGWLDPATGLG